MHINSGEQLGVLHWQSELVPGAQPGSGEGGSAVGAVLAVC